LLNFAASWEARVDGAVVAGHNVRFDMRMFATMAAALGVSGATVHRVLADQSSDGEP
jgi:hypothetical protein